MISTLRTSLYKNASISRGTSFCRQTERSMASIHVDHLRGGWKTYGDTENYRPGKFQIKLFNKISPKGLVVLSDEYYDIRKQDEPAKNAHAILLRSHKLQEDEVAHTVRAIARCGAGTNNIPVARMSELGIPVFNTPGANANAVKELVICGLLLGSRKIIAGINHMKSLGEQGTARDRVEKDKAMFGGREIKDKTLAVIGLGNIGAATALDASELGMKVKGYDPGLSVKAALRLPSNVHLTDSITSAVADADYISLNIPYVKGEGGTHQIIGSEIISHFKQGSVLLNFARGELVDSDALKVHLDTKDGCYITDFPDDVVWDHVNAVVLPHLGASTGEAEDEAARMASETIKLFLEDGTIRHSVNFPSTTMERPEGTSTVRFTVVNKNVPGTLAHITESFANAGMNIVQQINQSRGEIAYNMLDIEVTGKDVTSFKEVQEVITKIDHVLSTRVLFGTPGKGYARKIDGEYFV